MKKKLGMPNVAVTTGAAPGSASSRSVLEGYSGELLSGVKNLATTCWRCVGMTAVMQDWIDDRRETYKWVG